MKIIFATHNSNKVKEIQELIGNSFELCSLYDFGYNLEIPETGKTIEENSFLKADFIWKKFGIPCFADDTGLEIHSLNGEPGVLSARYAGNKKNDEENIEKVLSKMKNLSQREARFKTVITFIINNTFHQFTGIVNGVIAYHKSGTNGFGYDPIFIPEKETKSFAEMTLEEKNSFSHRARALDKLIDYLKIQKL